MAWKSISMFVMVGVCFVLVGSGSAASADDENDLNRFYRSVVQTIKKPGYLKELVGLVEKNPALAKRCLDICGQKAQVPGEEGKALAMVQQDLQAAFLLSSKSPKCDEDCVQHVLDLIGEENNDDESILWLKKLVNLCPRAGRAYRKLGNLCSEQSRWGEAIAAYKKAVDLIGDEDSRLLLKKAQEYDKEYVKQPPLQSADVKDLFSDHDIPMGPGVIVRKAIQRQILFDEWSFRIKEQFQPDLKVIGEGLKEELSKQAKVRLLIEGHTDKRGPLDRNKKLSKDRAEAIKGYLVQHYGIDSAVITTEGCGPTRPYSPDENEAGYALNRRVEFKKLDSVK